MKAFWFTVALLVALTSVLLFRQYRAAQPPAPITPQQAETNAQFDLAQREMNAPPAPVPAPASPADLVETGSPDVAPIEPAPPQPASIPVAEAGAPPQPDSTPATPPAPVVATAQTPITAPRIETLDDLNKLLGLPSMTEPSTAAATPQPAPGSTAAAATATAPAAPPDAASAETAAVLDERFKNFEVVPARKRQTDDGWTLLDERFPVRGAGTADDPLQVTWDLLASASETFQPRLGKKRLPERIVMLDGKHVRVTGYVAFPILAAAQNEMLSMRNMWDGCCIGVPPTPYDAIEVRLGSAASGKDRFTSYGTVEGKFSVDPYIKGNWLLGLYLMDDAKLSQEKAGGDPAKHGGM
ncbi:MAG: hypothetical protein SFZ24_04290 [Planctomycetota bacterium]|nr:hypothetical protein [Planctomycetota bacterium]